MKCHKTILPNGLRLLTIPMPSFESVTVTIWVGVGSRYETKQKAGIAHFFEHIVFKGSKKRPTAKAISEAIDNFGGEFNAFTGKELTGFYVKAPVDRIEDAVDVLSDMILNPLIPEKEVEKEKGVIASEIDMIQDTPMRNITNVFHSIVFKGSPLKNPVIGTKETVSSITRKDFLNYRKQFYSPKNIVISVAGGITEARSKALITKYFKSMKGSKVKKSLGKKVLSQKKPQIKLEYKKTDQAHIIIGYLGAKANHKDSYVEEVLRAVLSGGMSSRMFINVRERKGLCYAVKSSIHPYLDTGAFLTYVGTDIKKAPDAIKAILAEYQKLTDPKTAKLTKAELTKAKEYIKGHLALSLESTNEVGDFFGSEELLFGKTKAVEEIYQKIDAVTDQEVIALAKHFFQTHRLSLAAIGPFKSEAKFKKLLS